MSELQARSIDHNPSAVNAVNEKACCWCGKVEHFSRDKSCPARGKPCYKCGKEGQLSSRCKTSDKKIV